MSSAPMSARGRKWKLVGTQPEGRHRPTADIPIGREGHQRNIRASAELIGSIQYVIW